MSFKNILVEKVLRGVGKKESLSIYDLQVENWVGRWMKGYQVDEI